MSKVGQIVRRPRRHWTMPFGAGDRVVQRCDPRHVGRVRYAEGTMVRVQWENGWISENQASELDSAEDFS